jgi:hypothetical protein
VTHFMDEAETLCDRLVVVDDGRVIAEGSPQGLIDRYGEGSGSLFRRWRRFELAGRSERGAIGAGGSGSIRGAWRRAAVGECGRRPSGQGDRTAGPSCRARNLGGRLSLFDESWGASRLRLLAKMSWLEQKLFLREPLTVLFALALPLVVLFVMGGVFGNDSSPISIGVSEPWTTTSRRTSPW